jgi:hypothetical protein
MSTFYQPLAGAGKAESRFATMGADDDMDTQIGFITDDEESEDDFDESMYQNFAKKF